MHVVVSSSCVVFQQRITSFAILRFGFVGVLGVEFVYMFFLTGPLFDLCSMHFIPLLICLLSCVSQCLLLV